LLLGRALVADPEILLLDEPCQGLDQAAQDHVLERVAAWADNPARTLIYVTHRPDEVNPEEFQRLVLPWGSQGRS
jgi:ABC-type molybdenum transport system ATPase subunit/photorepair protein PhrA